MHHVPRYLHTHISTDLRNAFCCPLTVSGHPSAAGRAQDRESSPVKDRRSTNCATQPTKRFISNIQQTDWDLDNCDFTSFSETFTSIFDNCFPFEKYSIRKNTPRKPWMTKGLARSRTKKEKLYKTRNIA